MWNIYLDGEMGLVPETLALAELRAAGEQLAQKDFEDLRARSRIPRRFNPLISSKARTDAGWS